jgi:hypothetical protein
MDQYRKSRIAEGDQKQSALAVDEGGPGEGEGQVGSSSSYPWGVFKGPAAR